MSEGTRSHPLPPARILLVEDAPDQAFLMSEQLQQLGPFEVVLVQDGLGALERAGGEYFDLIVTDLNLPGLDGFEFMNGLGERAPEVPILVVTGSSEPADAERARAAGADELLVKPVEQWQLHLALARLLPDRFMSRGGPARVLAVGLRPGDLAFGCGASLAAHRASGHEVTVLVVADAAAEGRGLGGEDVQVTEDFEEAVARVAELVRSLAPDLAYLPSPRDEDDAPLDLYDRVRTELESVPGVLGYATPTSSMDFRPSTYRDVGGHMKLKLAALPAGGPAPDALRAHAVYWGRFADFGEAEPFEVLRQASDRSLLT